MEIALAASVTKLPRIAIGIAVFAICTATAQAQMHPMMACGPANVRPGSIASVTPNVLNAGQEYQLVITGDFPGNEPEDVMPGCARDLDFFSLTPPQQFDWNVDQQIRIQTDEGFTVNSGFAVGAFSPSQTTITVKVGPKHPSGFIYLALNCDGCDYRIFSGPIQIVNTGPTITSVSPAAWFAGRSYNVTINGTNFLTASDPGGPTELQIAAPGADVQISNQVVVSSTQITATVSTRKNTTTEWAKIKVTNPSTAANPGTGEANEPILPFPIIFDWNGNQISGGSGVTEQVVVGQPINLTTNLPTSPFTLPGGTAVSSNAWKVGGTNIGGYSIAQDGSSASVQDTDITQASLKTYWLYPTPEGNDGFKVKYHYCVSINDIPDPCSEDAVATFDHVIGPSATVQVVANMWSVTPQMTCNQTLVQFLYLGIADPVSGCAISPLTKGISFQASISNIPDSGGTTKWDQLIRRNVLSGALLSGGKVVPTEFPVGLDKSDPYGPDDPTEPFTTQASDSPATDLDPVLARETRRFRADMYYLWKSAKEDSIWVPLDFIAWTTVGTARQVIGQTPPWSIIASAQPTVTSHVCSESQQKCSPPTWGPSSANAMMDVSDLSDNESEDE